MSNYEPLPKDQMNEHFSDNTASDSDDSERSALTS